MNLVHGCHRAGDDCSPFLWDFKAHMRVVYEFQQWYKTNGGAAVEKLCFGREGGSP